MAYGWLQKKRELPEKVQFTLGQISFPVFFLSQL
jgi:hypothetical protein